MVREPAVLVDDQGAPIGAADKGAHCARARRHLGFSYYGVDRTGRLLVARESRRKREAP